GRRRHTRFSRDWSSDVCSSDLGRVLTLDVTAPGKVRAEAGLPADHYQSVIANPPFFDPGRGTAPAEARAAARHMDAAALDRWVTDRKSVVEGSRVGL